MANICVHDFPWRGGRGFFDGLRARVPRLNDCKNCTISVGGEGLRLLELEEIVGQSYSGPCDSMASIW